MQTTQTTQPAPRTWKPTTAGILNIIVGVFSLIGTFFMSIGAFFFANAAGWAGLTQQDFEPMTLDFLVGIIIAMAIFSGVTGILALIGGIYSLQRRLWGLALAGSIAAILSSTILGILSTIFVSMGKDEFS